MAKIIGLDHVQLAMPARQPANLATRGGVWFKGGLLRLHRIELIEPE